MILYALCCSGGHEFEAWFRSGDDFGVQSERKLLTCPVCGDGSVRRALMTPAVVTRSRGRAARTAEPSAEPGAGAGAAPPMPSKPSGAPGGALALKGEVMPPADAAREMSDRQSTMPDALRAVLSRMRSEIEKHCDDVGTGFADEALRMHRGMSERRGIYGQATEAEREALNEEGVEIASIPWLPRSDG